MLKFSHIHFDISILVFNKERTDQTLKPLISVKGRPFPDHVLNYLESYRVSHVVLSVGYLAEQFRARYGAEYQSMKISYAVETEPKGTGSAGLINGGIYVGNKAALHGILPDQGAFSFERDFLEPKVNQLRPAGITFDSYFIDIGVRKILKERRGICRLFQFKRERKKLCLFIED